MAVTPHRKEIVALKSEFKKIEGIDEWLSTIKNDEINDKVYYLEFIRLLAR